MSSQFIKKVRDIICARHITNIAFNMLVFLFRHVLNIPLDNIDAIRTAEKQRIAVVLNQREIDAHTLTLPPHILLT